MTTAPPADRPTLSALRGLPGSGKTHVARRYVADAPGDRERVSLDDLDRMLENDTD